MIENKEQSSKAGAIPEDLENWMATQIKEHSGGTKEGKSFMTAAFLLLYRHLNAQPSHPRLINVRVEATEATKEDIILKAIIQNTGIRADSYLDAIQHFWLTFDPTPAMNVVKKAMDAWVNAQPSPVLAWIDAEDDLPTDQDEEYFIRWRQDGVWHKLTAFYDNDAKEFYTVESDCRMEYMSIKEFKGLQWLKEPDPTHTAQ